MRRLRNSDGTHGSRHSLRSAGMTVREWPDLALALEERLQQRRALHFIQTAEHFRPMMAGRLLEDLRAVLHATALGIAGGEDDAPEPGERDRGRAHRARLQRHVEIAQRQALF